MLVGAQLRSNSGKLVGTLYTRRLLAKFIFFILLLMPARRAPTCLHAASRRVEAVRRRNRYDFRRRPDAHGPRKDARKALIGDASSGPATDRAVQGGAGEAGGVVEPRSAKGSRGDFADETSTRANTPGAAARDARRTRRHARQTRRRRAAVATTARGRPREPPSANRTLTT